MTFNEVMTQLKSLGTAQNVKVYKRHGCGDNVFGVSFANLGTLKKRIKVDHGLAEQLWQSGNVDARALATMIADPAQLTGKQAEEWLKDLQYYGMCDLFAGLVSRSSIADAKMTKWMASKKEYVRQAGYTILAHRLKDEPDAVSDDFCVQAIATIETEIHDSANRARHAMNMALIAIGIYKHKLKSKAIAAANHIGKVEVDHGETGCKTPDAVTYIEKTIARKKPKRNNQT